MNKSTRFYSDKQEKKVAKAVGGKQTANSGATAFSKGDVRTELFLIECKTATTAKSAFRIEREWFQKNKEEAFAMGKLYNAVCFDFGPNTDRHYVIDEKLFQFLVKQLEQAEGI